MNEKNMRILIVIPATLVLETVGPLYFNCNLIIDWSYTQFSATCAYLLFFAGRCDVKLVQRNKEAFKEAQQENKIYTIMKLQRKSQWKIYYVWNHPYLFLEPHMDNICRQICQYISAPNGGHFLYTCVYLWIEVTNIQTQFTEVLVDKALQRLSKETI